MAVASAGQGRKSRKITGFWRASGGSVAIVFGLLLIPMLALMGLAIDGWRALNAAELAESALDAAALAAAKALNDSGLDDSELQEVARRFFEANAMNGRPAQGATFSNLSVTADRTRNAVTVSVDAQVPTTFTKLLKYDSLGFSRSATAVYNMTELELGLMLDITGSMAGSKIRDLKLAAGDLVDMLIPDRRGGGNTRIGIAPYAAAVNAGAYARIATGGESGDGCAIEREGRDAYTDAAPAAGRHLGAYPSRDVRRNDHYDCPASEILPITDDKRALKRSIARFDARGYTAGHLGLAWGWYLVSPDWSTVWPAASRPEPYGRKDLIKAVVMMTDGEFNTSYRNGRPNQTSDEQARTLCGSMKDKEVVVFAIGFELNQRNAIRTLEECATSPRHFYLAEDGAELRQAFRDIAVKLTKLRLAK